MSTRPSSFLSAMTLKALSALTSDLHTSQLHVTCSPLSPPVHLWHSSLTMRCSRFNPRAMENSCSDGHTQACCCSQGPCRCVQLEGRGGPASENIIPQRMPQGLCQEYQPHVIGAWGAGRATIMPPGKTRNPPLTAFKKRFAGRTKS